MPSLKDKIKTKKPLQQPKEPAWKGPEVDGVTQSLLGRFLGCRERFRVLTVEGLQPAPQFNARLEFGNMWHICEEALALEERKPDVKAAASVLKGVMLKKPSMSYGEAISKCLEESWKTPLDSYCQELCRSFPFQQEQIVDWSNKTAALFPLYATHWAEHPDVKDRTPLLAEQVFDVPYRLPSGRMVRLRGKWDSVDLVGKGKNAGVWLQENKTKSSIDAGKIHRQLKFDLQTMLYLVALEIWVKQAKADDALRQIWYTPCGKGESGGILIGDKAYKIHPLLGVRYNVIRRSSHKSVESMLKKLEEDRAAGRIGEWFSRWNVEVTAGDVARFRRECLDPILEQLCDWWDYIQDAKNVWDGSVTLGRTEIRTSVHWRHPFGVYNALDEGGFGDVDEYLDTGSTVGLQRVENLFPELS